MNKPDKNPPRILVHELGDDTGRYGVTIVCANLEDAQLVAQLVAARIAQAVPPGRPPAEA